METKQIQDKRLELRVLLNEWLSKNQSAVEHDKIVACVPLDFFEYEASRCAHEYGTILVDEKLAKLGYRNCVPGFWAAALVPSEHTHFMWLSELENGNQKV